MKKLFVAVAAVVFFTTASFADFAFMKNVKFYGEGSLIGYNNNNGYGINAGKLMDLNFNSNSKGVSGFITVGMTFDMFENVEADFSLAYSNDWADGGNKFLSLVNNLDYSPAKGNSLNSYLDTIRVQTANVTFKKLFGVDGLSAKIGRQYYGDEDSTVMYFGIRRYQPGYGLNLPLIGFDQVSSVNAATLYYEKENIKANIIYANLGKILGMPLGLDGLIGKLINATDFIDLDKDSTITGADIKIFNISDMFGIQAYGYDFENPIVRHYTMLGVKPSFKLGGFKASVEFAKNFAGSQVFSNEKFIETDLNGYDVYVAGNSNLFKVDASYDIEKTKLTPRASFVMQGGTKGMDKFLNGEFTSEIGLLPFFSFGNYVPGIVFGQQAITRILSMIDFRAINVGANYSLKDFNFAFDYFNLATRDSDINYGNEIDVTAKYKYSKNIEFYLGIGYFMRSDDLTDKLEDIGFDRIKLAETSSTIQLGVTYKF